jgi:hypothetical protein
MIDRHRSDLEMEKEIQTRILETDRMTEKTNRQTDTMTEKTDKTDKTDQETVGPITDGQTVKSNWIKVDRQKK